MTVKIDGTNTVANPAFTGADTDTGLQCGTNEVKLVTGGTARATVNSSGNMGIGTTTPNNRLTLHSSTTGTFDAFNITSGLTNSDGLQFGIDSASNVFIWHTANGGIRLATNNVERARVTNNGITFNGDTAADNALSDYEEGTFTPTYASGVTNVGYQVQEGSYTKIGDLVTCFIEIKANSGSNNNSHLGIGGLPFTASNTKDQGGGYFGYRDDLAGGSTNVYLHVPKNSSILYFYTQSGSIWSGNDGNGIYNRNIHVQCQYFT